MTKLIYTDEVGSGAMTGFADGQYIDEQRMIRNQDGSPDELGRWVDERGYVRLSSDEFDGNWFIDAQGQPHDETGMPNGAKVIVPGDWSVELEPSADTVAWQGAPTPSGDDEAMADAILARQIQERDAGLSRTQGTSPKAGALDAFVGNIAHTAPATDAAGGDLTWAGRDITPDQQLAGQRALSPEYVGEDQRSAAFKSDTMRGRLDATNTQWTTDYDTGQTNSVADTSVTGGLLCGPDGTTPLNGTFGYVVDPSDGSIYTFDQSEGYVSKGGDWIPLAGLGRSQVIALIQQALDDGEQVSYVHHSSPLAGQPVAGAGQLTVDGGKITKINDESGHYKPEGEYLWQTITWLKQAGMPIQDIDVTLIAKGQEPELILKGWQFAQTGGNQAQARLKEQVVEQLGAPQRAEQEQERRREEAERQRAAEEQRRRTAGSFVPGSRQDLHYKKFGCTNFNPDGSNTYCMGCDNDL